MGALPLGNLVRPLARLYTKEEDDILLLPRPQGLHGQGEGVGQFVLLAQLLPRGIKVALHDSLYIVGPLLYTLIHFQWKRNHDGKPKNLRIGNRILIKDLVYDYSKNYYINQVLVTNILLSK